MRLKRFQFSDSNFDRAFGAFLALRRQGAQPQVDRTVGAILGAVGQRGGGAVAEFTEQFDGLTIDPETLGSDAFDLRNLASECPEDVRSAIDHAAERISIYHEQNKPSDGAAKQPDEISLSWRWTPVDSVGVYVPGGRASYPSTVLMNVIPARVAGVSRIVMTSPAHKGTISPAVAYAAVRAGVDEFYPIGGAQAVAALALGAGRLNPVVKIVGPGNAYVAAAKRMVFGLVGIDSIAGPSELTVVAGDENRADWTAADLLSQAEHDPMAQSILVTDSVGFADQVEAELARLLPGLGEASAAAESLANYGAIVVSGRDRMPEIIDLIAPEHVEVALANGEEMATRIKHAGAIFVGPWACEALGDYITGSNHVLPTSGAARFMSGLSTADFMKRISIQEISRAGFDTIAASAETLAICEGLPAHALSVGLRRRTP